MAKVVIVGGGLSGLSFAYYLRAARPGWEVLVLEKDERLGGKARTLKEDGFIVELGVNGVLDNKPSTIGLAKDLGLKILMSNQDAKRRFVVKDGHLEKLPESPKEFLFSGLLSIGGRIRVAMEPFIPKGETSKDESLAAFAQRRLGKEAYLRLIDPMATGIYAGDPERLSLKSCFPRIHELESRYGSLIRAMITLSREAKKKKTGKKVGAGPGGNLVSFKDGMGEFVERLSQSLGGDIVRNGVGAREVIKNGRFNWEVVTTEGEAIQCTHVVLACPARDVSKITKGSIGDLSRLADAIDYPPVAVVAFGVKLSHVERSLRGFGFLTPGCEGRSILGTLWDSSVFINRAPEGWALLRSLVGGARRRDLPGRPDRELIDLTYKELKGLIGLKKAPDFVRVHRWPRAIPQYNVGHEDQKNAILAILKKHPGLFIRCNWIGGVSLNDCVQNSKQLASTI